VGDEVSERARKVLKKIGDSWDKVQMEKFDTIVLPNQLSKKDYDECYKCVIALVHEEVNDLRLKARWG